MRYFPRSILIIILAALTLLVSCADIFQPKISFSDMHSPSSLNDLFSGIERTIKLQTPSHLYVDQYFSPSQIRLTWTSVPLASYYMVERATAQHVPGSNLWEIPEDSEFEPLNPRFVYGTSFTDTILSGNNLHLDAPQYNNRYYYRVTAFSTSNQIEESNPTAAQWAMLFSAPFDLRATGGNFTDRVVLNWEHTQGAVAYEIWRSNHPDGSSPINLGQVQGNLNSFQNNVSTAEQGRDFYYMVRARNRFGNYSMFTRPAYGYARMFGAPNPPANVRFALNSGRGNSRTEMRIEWDPVLDEDIYYAVFRFSSADSSLTMLTEKTENTFWFDNDPGLSPGVYYYYRLQSIKDEAGTGPSQFSSPDLEGFLLSSPGTVAAEKNNNGQIIIKWLPAIGSDTERSGYTYNVYSSSSINGVYSSIASGIGANTDMEGFISHTLSPSSGPFFRVSTTNGSVTSAQSAAVSPAPDAPEIISATQHAFIANVTESDSSANPNGVYPVIITWKKPDNDTPFFYQVQRSTRSSGGFTRIHDSPLPASGSPSTAVFSYDTGTGIYTFIDRNESARAGRKFYYRVLSLNQLEQGNFFSQERIGWGALTHEKWMEEFNKTYSSAIYKLTLMHRSSDMDKLGTETKQGTLSGYIYYNARIAGLGGDITVTQTNYCDFYIENVPANGYYFILNGNSGSTANMQGNGSMKNETVTATGMYPGTVFHGNVQLTGGRVSGGSYRVTPSGFSARDLLAVIHGYSAGR